MFDYKRFALGRIASFGTRYMPFADVACKEVPLSRLLRLSLFQVTVGMALVLMAGTLNRVMIVELRVPATLVAVMLALPLVFAPFRALIGFRSDSHRSALGLRRLPYIWKGTMLQFGGFAIMPFALLVLSGYGEAVDAPRWIGLSAAALSFLLVGAGVHMVQTVGLALATDLVPQADQPRVVGLMYVMLLVGMIVSAFAYGALLDTYTPGRLIQVIQGSAVLTVAVNGIAMWKQEARNRSRAAAPAQEFRFTDAWARLAGRTGMVRLLAVIGLGTAGFGMADVLLEPFGGQVLSMTVAQTTRLTVVLALGSLLGFGLASRWLGRGGRAMDAVCLGAMIGIPAFGLVLASAVILSAPLLVGATLLAGFGAGLFGHGTLTATMQAAPREQIGLSLGAWGAVQATAAGLAIATGGVIRDLVLAAPAAGTTAASPYVPVFALEGGLLLLAVIVALPLRRGDPAAAFGPVRAGAAEDPGTDCSLAAPGP
ncbi:MAG: PucC family protein [Rhodobacter sp.]|nr:PucC family protein [Rhodobacter sp.]MCA3511982.1 PucC family protein [Rhodobacter sp.]MCA3520719.1 PucC family protein [Rhodobacter sp.]MCA3522276.1 PucC family protein [Rhodobacter sp.]MCA3526853.1 PucC family protein [Rhodobacter sp.]